MEFNGARRVMETTSFETANQYLRFGWKLINQYVMPAEGDKPAAVNYVLGSFRSLEDTRQVISLEDSTAVNQHLTLGWKLLDQYLTQSPESERRHQTVHFILAWQHEEPPAIPSAKTSTAADDDSEIELGKRIADEAT